MPPDPTPDPTPVGAGSPVSRPTGFGPARPSFCCQSTSSAMKILALLILAGLAVALFATTSILHGQVDFATPPAVQYDFGSYNAIMLFKTSTVIRFHGGTWFVFSVPFYVLALGAAAVPFCCWSLLRKSNHEAVD